MIRVTPPRPRFIRALALSLALHAAVLFPAPWSFSIEPAASQIYLQASLRPPPSARELPTEKSGPAKTKPEPHAGKPKGTRRLATEHGSPVKLAPPEGKEKSPEQANPPELEPHQAVILDQALPPEYPTEALQRKLEGCVLASVTVGPTGEVVDVRILQSDHPGIFDQSVIESQRAARYLPAQKDGEAVESRVLTVAAFVLDSARKMNCALRFVGIAEELAGMRK